MTAAQVVFLATAALAAGAVNAIAGGGSLISFPALTAIGLPPVVASITNTIAMCPGYFGASVAQRRQLVGQGARMRLLLPIAAVSGIGGGLLLLHAGAAAFDHAVPFLILFAALLVGVQDPVRRWLLRPGRARRHEAWAVLPVILASIYGGYFGAGLGMIILGALGIIVSPAPPCGGTDARGKPRASLTTSSCA